MKHLLYQMCHHNLKLKFWVMNRPSQFRLNWGELLPAPPIKSPVPPKRPLFPTLSLIKKKSYCVCFNLLRTSNTPAPLTTLHPQNPSTCTPIKKSRFSPSPSARYTHCTHSWESLTYLPTPTKLPSPLLPHCTPQSILLPHSLLPHCTPQTILLLHCTDSFSLFSNKPTHKIKLWNGIAIPFHIFNTRIM